MLHPARMLHPAGTLDPNGSPVRMSGVHRTFLVLVLLLTVIPGWRLFATLPSPGLIMDQVIPSEARAGMTVTVNGYALDPAHIQELYLVDDQETAYQAEILSESGITLRFRVPEKIPAGWMRIAVKAPGKAGLMEQMVHLKVTDPIG
jgi:hypothetical protein